VKKGIAILLVLLMALVMSGCGGQGAVNEPEQEEAVQEETVVDEAPVGDEVQEDEAAAEETPEEETEEAPAASGEISVSVPDGWEPLESAGMLYAYQKGTASFMMKTEPFSADSLDGVIDQSKEIFSGTFDNVQFVGETESITVGGVDASKVIFTSDFSGFTMKFEYIYFFSGGDVYAITFGDLGDTFDDNAADFQAILDSITIG